MTVPEIAAIFSHFFSDICELSRIDIEMESERNNDQQQRRVNDLLGNLDLVFQRRISTPAIRGRPVALVSG